jgi:hypothetical protein
MKSRFVVFAATLLLGAVLIPSAGLAENELNPNELNPGSSHDNHPDGRGNRNRESPPRGKNGTGGSVVTGNGISYHGGPVMHGTVNVYFIWYGDWSGDTKANGILTDWANGMGGSPYENINTTYGDTTGNVSGAIALGLKSTSMASTTFGTTLSDSSIAAIVSKALSTGSLPTDSNGVYFVLTAPGIAETSGFLSSYCGWHTYGNINGANIKYAFVGNAAGAHLGSCAWQTASSPNGDPAVDAMVSVMSHELEESASDPNLNAWYDTNGEENADKCAWTFGTTYSASGGGIANMKLGAREFLIQQNWVNANGGYCALSYASTSNPDFSLAVSPASQTLPSTGGTTGNYTITVTPTGGFSGTPSYAITGLPGWATASAVSAGAFRVQAASPVSGTYTFTITGTSGSIVHAITAKLVVSAPPPPTFNVTISPVSQAVNRGGTVTYTVTIAPVGGFTGTVGLSVSGAKTGLTPSLSATSIAASGTSTLTVVTTNSAKNGNNTLTITATYAGPGTPITKFAAATLKIN